MPCRKMERLNGCVEQHTPEERCGGPQRPRAQDNDGQPPLGMPSCASPEKAAARGGAIHAGLCATTEMGRKKRQSRDKGADGERLCGPGLTSKFSWLGGSHGQRRRYAEAMSLPSGKRLERPSTGFSEAFLMIDTMAMRQGGK